MAKKIQVMNDLELKDKLLKVDKEEFEIPETTFVRDIENRVFQSIVLQCLSKIEGIGLLEGNFIDHIFGRGGNESVNGIFVEQESKNQAVAVKVEVNIRYGLSIPEKAEEIQAKVSDELTKFTGLHVSCIHVVFKNILPDTPIKKMGTLIGKQPHLGVDSSIEEEYTDEF